MVLYPDAASRLGPRGGSFPSVAEELPEYWERVRKALDNAGPDCRYRGHRECLEGFLKFY